MKKNGRQVKTLTHDYSQMSGWTLTCECLEQLCAGNEISSPEEIRPCGCGVKLDLQDVVYPALRELTDEFEGLAERVDAFAHPGAFDDALRIVVRKGDLISRREELSKTFCDFGAQSLVELFTTSLDYFEFREETQAEFRSVLAEKTKLLTLAREKLRDKNGPDFRLYFGKGHSIQAEGDALVFDLIRYRSTPGYTVSNNDTIITADSVLKTSAFASVFTALNNALNDLFLMGVTEDLCLLPVYDGSSSEIQLIQEALRTYQAFYQERGVHLSLIDRGPLKIGTRLIGATVLGKANHEPPKFDGLRPGQEIIATRFLGDLSLLSMHRRIHFDPGSHPELDRLRIEVLQRFTTSHLLIARVIRKYLPDLDETTDPSRHLAFTSDVSGPGLSVLEEAARASGVDVYIDSLRFIDERSLKFYRRNQTSSTNGPIMMAGTPEVIQRLKKDLAAIGVSELWQVGKVLPKSDEPNIVLNPELEKQYRSSDPRTDFFAPEVHFVSGEHLHRERMPIFQKFKFQLRK